jgi:hypothetical protein
LICFVLNKITEISDNDKVYVVEMVIIGVQKKPLGKSEG